MSAFRFRTGDWVRVIRYSDDLVEAGARGEVLDVRADGSMALRFESQDTEILGVPHDHPDLEAYIPRTVRISYSFDVSRLSEAQIDALGTDILARAQAHGVMAVLDSVLQ